MYKKPRRKKKQKKEEIDAMPDRRAMEKMMQDLGRLLEEQEFESIDEANAFLATLTSTGTLPSRRADTPLEKAQDLVYEAWERPSRTERVRLARQALSISPDCTDAYVLLAEEDAESLEEAVDLYTQGVEAGERTLGPEMFEEGEGHFWGLIETRPYMRARAGLAQCLWQRGEQEEAIIHLQDLLRLNPGDNQGLRYVLADYLLYTDRDDELGALLDAYEDDASAFWMYNRALWLYRQEGRSPAANEALDDALDFNPFVPRYLLGKRRLPRQLPEYYGFGDNNEAVLYAVNALDNWRRTQGALAWLNKRLVGKRKSR